MKSALTALVMSLGAMGVGAAAAEIIRSLRPSRRIADLWPEPASWEGKPLAIDMRNRRRLSDINFWLMVNFRYPGRIWISRLRFIPKEETIHERQST